MTDQFEYMPTEQLRQLARELHENARRANQTYDMVAKTLKRRLKSERKMTHK